MGEKTKGSKMTIVYAYLAFLCAILVYAIVKAIKGP